jgi:ADP-heptose:LPS heptosyltransferase
VVKNGWFPDEFVTAQWDSTDPRRRLSKKVIREIEDKYECIVLKVGGEGQGQLKTSIPHIGLAMSLAKCHIGSDSGMMHIAQLYKDYEDIHIYDTDGSYKSHHLVRAINNGSKYFKV